MSVKLSFRALVCTFLFHFSMKIHRITRSRFCGRSDFNSKWQNMDFQYSVHLSFNSRVLAKVYCKCVHARTHAHTHRCMHTHTDKTVVSWTVC